MSIALSVDGLGGGVVEGEVEGGGSEGGAVTTGVEGCNKFAIAEFWSRFNADRELPNEGAEPLPAEAVERTLAVPVNGEGVVEATAAEPAEVTPGRGTTVVFVIGAVVAAVVSLVGSAVVCVTCPAAIPDVGAARSVWDDVVGSITETTAGRFVNAR